MPGVVRVLGIEPVPCAHRVLLEATTAVRLCSVSCVCVLDLPLSVSCLCYCLGKSIASLGHGRFVSPTKAEGTKCCSR